MLRAAMSLEEAERGELSKNDSRMTLLLYAWAYYEVISLQSLLHVSPLFTL